MPTYTRVNDKMISVALQNEEVYARTGSMVCYSGQVVFERSFLTGGGVQQLGMRAVTGEGYSMMRAKGTGTVYYAQNGMCVRIISLTGETLYVESNTLLAFDPRLRPGTMFLGNKGGVRGIVRGAATGQGLFTTTLEGRGEVAILSVGNTIGLPVTPEQPVFVDPNAYMGHQGELANKIVTDLNWKTFVGQTSGESYQMKFEGVGTVFIQASER
jgi:uncharacterized protein (AIM24 family)